MPAPQRVLIAGESWVMHTVHQKGFDSFNSTEYAEGVGWLRAALERAGFTVDFLPNHLAAREFPFTADALRPYTAVILSDIGANTLSLHPDTFARSIPHPNRLEAIRSYVEQGGALIMIGGYLSFQGIEARAAYRGTAIEDVLPVNLSAGDDRVELPSSPRPQVVRPEHPIVRDLPRRWPRLLGYNRLRAKDAATVLVECNGDPLVVVGSYGKGRALAFASDCGPHWAPLSFVEWTGYDLFWQQALSWLAGMEQRTPAWVADEEAELKRMHAGLAASQRKTIAGMQELKRHMHTGMTEREMVGLADRILRERGSSGPWCPYLVAFGESTRYCDPAHPPADRQLAEDDIAMVDLCPVFDGFYGDYSETIVWGTGGEHRGLVDAAWAIERATLAYAGECSTPDELFAFCQTQIAAHGLQLLDPLRNIGHSIGQFAFLEGFVESGNVRGLRGGWTIEPFVGNARAGAKFEDILFFGRDGVEVLGTGAEE